MKWPVPPRLPRARSERLRRITPSVCDDVGVKYGSKHAISGITMDIPLKRVTALIGPSGCGKSTLLRCLNRMNDLIPSARVAG